jgi:hypothetical protein
MKKARGARKRRDGGHARRSKRTRSERLRSCTILCAPPAAYAIGAARQRPPPYESSTGMIGAVPAGSVAGTQLTPPPVVQPPGHGRKSLHALGM